ncbi:MAG: TetR/AcrR family transcriptional regulator [Methylovirgula sp.]
MPAREPSAAPPPADPKDAIIGALIELAGERHWEDIPLADVATRANVSLSTFRDLFPSKGAVLAAFLRKIDKIVLDDAPAAPADEPAKERLIAVLRRRLDALAPYKVGLEGIHEWAGRDPFAALALNKLMINSMRFMLEAAGIDSEGPVGALKLQGLVIAWRRLMRTWFSDDDPELAPTLSVLDRELTRGGRFIAHAEDLNRLTAPLFSIARALFERRHGGSRTHEDSPPPP